MASVSSGDKAIARLDEKTPDLVLVDAESMRTSGRRICQSIRKKSASLPIILIVEKNGENGEKAQANVVLTSPFTLQKLLNRIRPFLPVEENKDLLVRGPIQLNVEHRWVRNGDRQTSLTPRLVSLLKILMEHPGEVIERKELFRAVWETEYTADTRTLDVHISWLREAIEENPRKPKYILTARGVGYRLDVEAPLRGGRNAGTRQKTRPVVEVREDEEAPQLPEVTLHLKGRIAQDQDGDALTENQG